MANVGVLSGVLEQPRYDASERTKTGNRSTDTSDHKRTGHGSAENDMRFRDLLDHLPAAIYTTDADGLITFVNRAAVDLSGTQPEIGKDKWCISWRLSRPDGTPLPHEQCPMAVALRENRPVRDIDVQVERPDGRRVPVMPFPTPLHDEAGRLAGAVNVLIDISKLKLAEQALAKRAYEQEALYQFTDRLYRAETLDDTIEAALDAIVRALGCSRASILLFDGAGVARFVGHRGLSDGYRRAVEGHCPWQPGQKDPEPIFVADIDDADEPESLKQIVRSENIRGLAFIPVVANGGMIGKFMTYYEHAHEFSWEERERAVTIARQLGFSIERRRAEAGRRAVEEALRVREERLRAVFNSSAVGVAVLTPDARFIEVNEAFCAITGYSANELKAEDRAALTHPDDRDRMNALTAELLSGDKETFAIEKRYVRKDGGLIWVQLSVSLARDAANQPLHLVALCQDITERKKAEAQRDLLVAELSHRVKNTLATVISIARQSFSRGPTPDEARASFEGRLRALAQTHSRLAEANWSTVPFQTMLLDVLAPFRQDDGRNVRLSGPPVELDAKRAVVLGMAFHELATNASKYGALSVKRGSVDVGWKVANGLLDIRWSESGGPAVAEPRRTGFGRLLLERALASDLDGKVEMTFADGGVRCAIAVPIEGLARH